MANRVPAGLSPRDGRKFGLTVGLAFLGLAALTRWRGGETSALVLGGLGAVLSAAGLLVPRWLGPVYAVWMRLALVLSRVTTPIFMGAIYFLVLTPTGIVRRMFGANQLRHRRSATGFWATRPAAPSDPASMTRQF